MLSPAVWADDIGWERTMIDPAPRCQPSGALPGGRSSYKFPYSRETSRRPIDHGNYPNIVAARRCSEADSGEATASTQRPDPHYAPVKREEHDAVFANHEYDRRHSRGGLHAASDGARDGYALARQSIDQRSNDLRRVVTVNPIQG
jgi:hypothetical protein